jgi:hypothetical protein
MKKATIDERLLAARINLVDERVKAENAHELDETMATLNEAPLLKLNNDELIGHEGVHGFYAELFQGFPDLHIDAPESMRRWPPPSNAPCRLCRNRT